MSKKILWIESRDVMEIVDYDSPDHYHVTSSHRAKDYPDVPDWPNLIRLPAGVKSVGWKDEFLAAERSRS